VTERNKHPRRDKRSASGSGLDTPMSLRQRRVPRFTPNPDAFGSATERFARFMGTPQFLLWMSVFCILWLGWNTIAPVAWRFEPAGRPRPCFAHRGSFPGRAQSDRHRVPDAGDRGPAAGHA
jgi:hypothetical protein